MQNGYIQYSHHEAFGQLEPKNWLQPKTAIWKRMACVQRECMFWSELRQFGGSVWSLPGNLWTVYSLIMWFCRVIIPILGQFGVPFFGENSSWKKVVLLFLFFFWYMERDPLSSLIFLYLRMFWHDSCYQYVIVVYQHSIHWRIAWTHLEFTIETISWWAEIRHNNAFFL